MSENKLKLLEKLQKSDMIYVLMSMYTRMPYVVCDEETFDDEILLFFDEEAAKKEAEQLNESGNPVHIVKVEQKFFLEFYTSLFPIGVNCLRVDKGTENEVTIQHDELVRRGDASEVPEGKVRVENPALHLTALYFVQEFRKKQEGGMSEEVAELYEEMRAHFGKGQYIVPSEEGKGIPMLKHQEGKVFLPVFTDIQEFQKFNREGKLKGGVVAADKLSELLTEEMTGVALNPFGVNLVLNFQKMM